MRKIKTALTSYGMSGYVFHGPFLKTNRKFDVVKILERSKNNSERDFPDAQIVRNYDDILNDKDVELIIVNLPDHLHYDFAKQALNSNKHVVVEKPFTQNVAEGEELINLAKSKNLVLSVFQNRRWDGDFLTIKSIIEQGLLSRLVEYESQFSRFRNFVKESWKEDPSYGTGTLYNLGPHLIDQALVLFGMPEGVYAELWKHRDNSQIDDAFEIKLIYPRVKVLLKASYLNREPGPKFILHGTEGSYVKWGNDPQEETLQKGILPDSKDWGKEPEACWGLLNSNISDMHYRGKIETLTGNYNIFYDNIYNTICKNEKLAVTPEEALNVIRIIEACNKSNETNMMVKL